jgi:hypothetical protein
VIAAEVGRFYMVPHIFVPGGFYGSTRWVPVLGEKHRDKEHINFEWEHWHVDWRFAPAEMFARCTITATGQPHGKVISNDSYPYNGTPKLTGSPVMRRSKCKREMPDFPARPKAAWASLEKAYAGCVLKDGHICPHRGIDLRPFAKPDGTVICPGHGLRWDMRTGWQLPHHTEAA